MHTWTPWFSAALIALSPAGLGACDDAGGGTDTRSPTDTGPAADSGPTADTGAGADTGPGEDTGAGADTGPGEDTAACAPACDGRACGDDGCGGTCGPGCDADQACDADGQCVPVGVSACPPAGPFGTEVGDVIPDVQLADCDGNPVSLHALCERQAGYLFLYAGW